MFFHSKQTCSSDSSLDKQAGSHITQFGSGFCLGVFRCSNAPCLETQSMSGMFDMTSRKALPLFSSYLTRPCSCSCPARQHHATRCTRTKKKPDIWRFVFHSTVNKCFFPTSPPEDRVGRMRRVRHPRLVFLVCVSCLLK